MKLNIHTPNIETSEDFQSSFFNIGDPAMVFEILRSKLYSNPIQSVCREISSNSRDAHREVGKFDVPCKIILPNTLEPFITFKDYGTGISPDRIENIFIRYGSSTKREDNIQSGGFGLGSKSVFSVTDTFSVVTYFNGVKYHYACFIDETRVGKLSLLSKEATTECNGTEIIIPVRPQDFRTFAESVEFVTRHWEVKPIVTGARFSYQEITPVLSGKNWFFTKSDGTSSRNVKLIIDGIEYPVDIYFLKGYANTSIINYSYGIFYLKFGVGELSLQASREAVHLDKATQSAIATRLDEVTKDIKNITQDTINKIPNFWDANYYYHNELARVFPSVSFLNSVTWNGTPLLKGAVYPTSGKVFTFNRSIKGNKPTRILKTYFNFSANSEIYFNDLNIKEPVSKHVQSLFETNPNLAHVYVISSDLPYNKFEEANKVFHFDKLGIKNLSTITSGGKPKNFSGNRLIVFKFDTDKNAFKQVKYDSIEEDTNEKVLCFLERNMYNGTRQAELKGKIIPNDIVKSLIDNFPNISIYGVDYDLSEDKIKENFEGFMDLNKFIQNKVIDNNSINYKLLKHAAQNSYNINHRLINLYQKFKESIEDKNSLFLKELELHNSLNETYQKYKVFLNIYESINGPVALSEVNDYVEKHPEMSLAYLCNKVKTTYPLLNHLNSYLERLVDPAVHYINLVDKELNKKLNNKKSNVLEESNV